MKYPYPLVEVLWVDAYTDHGWENEVEVREELVITVGFLVTDNEKGLCIASSTGEDGSHNARIVIPAGMIRQMRTINGRKRKSTKGDQQRTGSQNRESGNETIESGRFSETDRVQDRSWQCLGPKNLGSPD